ncbi:MAG: DUF3761 domain-containing protein [Proteobacteria bacterium]|nr:DUF3761 domain-containing protein [Pseudomonadota bacterium]
MAPGLRNALLALRVGRSNRRPSMRAAILVLALALASTQAGAKGACRDAHGRFAKCPAATATTPAPAGATALCKDGTYSMSKHHSGACSNHGGVAKWL